MRRLLAAILLVLFSPCAPPPISHESPNPIWVSDEPAPHRSPSPEPTPAETTPGTARRVESTAYCLQGTTASGIEVRDGLVAMNGHPFGSRWEILSGPLQGSVVEVQDRIGHSSTFDIAMPGDCVGARLYGRKWIQIRRVN